MTDLLKGRTIVVAGGGRGLGRATALEVGEQGGAVVVNDLGTGVDGSGTSDEPAETTAAAVRKAGGEAIAHYGDVTSLEYADRLIADAAAEYGRVDGVVNFAGILQDGFLTRLSGEQWDRVIEVHLRGHFALLRAAAVHWQDREDRENREDDDGRAFLCVTSPSALGNPGQANYAAAKAGVLGLMRTAARELDRFGVRVNALMPVAYTRMIENMPTGQRPFDAADRPAKQVAPVAAYLLSEAAADVTGRTVRAEGERVSTVSDPQICRTAIREGGWSAEALAEDFEDRLGSDGQ